MQWAIADCLGLILKDGPETYHYNFDPPQRGWLAHFGTPGHIIYMGSWKASPHDGFYKHLLPLAY